MIKIEVISCNGTPPSQPFSTEFDELGGNIGRAEGNTLVLHDPERHISRVHASIAFRDGKYFIRSLGSASPVYLNDQPLNNGQEASIVAGDQIRINGYVMQVTNKAVLDSTGSNAATGLESDPFAFLDDHPDKNVPACPVAELAHDAVAPKEIIPHTKFIDDPDPFAIVVPESSELIPSDFDSLAKTPSSADVLSSGSESSAEKKIIDNFIDPGDPLVELPDKSNADSVDPLVVMDFVPEKKINVSRSDDIPERKGSFNPPKVKPDAGVTPPEIKPERKFVEAPVSTKSTENKDELLRAFLAGAGVPDLEMPNQLTPELMELIGQLLRESTQGTLDLLRARSETKSAIRADRTLIAPQDNNPLKFSPNVEAALVHLLAPKGRCFMTPQQAMKDAHDDLRSHQFGFMAGMRAALAGVLERFDPQTLEQRLTTQKNMMDAVFPMNHRAKLWDLFIERYSDISREAEEDFHALFGKEFLRAYEAQVAKLDQREKKIL